jgi:hypothetical protein
VASVAFGASRALAQPRLMSIVLIIVKNFSLAAASSAQG